MNLARLVATIFGCVVAAFVAALVVIGDQPAAVAAQSLPAVEAAIPGMTGHFALKTAGNRDVTEASFPGKWLVIYFGYTLCPDACPTALNAISAALTQLGPFADKIQPVFITVDPKRDTPAVIAEYVKAFDPRMVGLTGSEAQSAAAAKAFHVYYEERKLGNGEYAIDHSSFVYVVNPAGQVVQLLSGNMPAAAMAAVMRNSVK